MGSLVVAMCLFGSSELPLMEPADQFYKHATIYIKNGKWQRIELTFKDNRKYNLRYGYGLTYRRITNGTFIIRYLVIITRVPLQMTTHTLSIRELREVYLE